MAIAEKKIKVRVMDKTIPERVHVVQSDTGRSVRCVVADWSIPRDSTATVYVLKLSKAIVYNSCTVDVNTNSVIVELTNQMIAETGLSAAMVEITASSEVVTAFQFILAVDYKVSGGTESMNESTVLEEMFAELSATVTAAVAAAEAAASSANETATAATAAAESAETAAAAVYTDRNFLLLMNDDGTLTLTYNDESDD